MTWQKGQEIIIDIFFIISKLCKFVGEERAETSAVRDSAVGDNFSGHLEASLYTFTLPIRLKHKFS